ncbi:MAG: Aerobic glycerol-3-phosphate dehydrogenase [Gammaproteobacteria bacterium]|nr:Aerobic glycerol-3-phosphate dehydrogenase [Gammaproteobacteria bacterium]
MVTSAEPPYDLLVIGGGINGVGIARDAAGRGLSVLLVEQGDLASGTSSASSKLVHGGLRYLEQYEFRLVRESLAEREVLLAAAPHIIWPLRFVLPIHSGLRPPWMLRAGLFLYDHIGGRKVLPPTRTVRRERDRALLPLHERYVQGFEYSDCWADDARLVVINAIDAADRGACIEPGWHVTAARREGELWFVDMISVAGQQRTVRTTGLVNAAGPWVEEVLRATGSTRRSSLRLVKGSHVVVPRLYDGPQAFTLQTADRRIVFIIPYHDDFTLIGTTDIPFTGDPAKVSASADEIEYLCGLASEYLKTPVSARDAVWSYSGVRPLYDDGDVSASTVTREYVFDLDTSGGRTPLLSVFGGKLTTYRRLAEHAMAELRAPLRFDAREWTRGSILPGGDIDKGDFEMFSEQQAARYAFAPPELVRRLCRAYGTRVERIMGNAQRLRDLGEEMAPQLYEAELQYMRDHEWARSGEDALWRRSKLGLRFDGSQRQRVAAWFNAI